MINIGILGAAKIAPKGIIWPSNERQDCTVFAVASRSYERAQSFAKTHNIPNAFGDYETLIAHPDIDLIYNALPPNRHADLSIAALAAGKSVLCEKPFAMNAAQAETMVAAANRAKGHLMEAFHYRFHPAALKFLNIIHRGQIGSLRSMKGTFNVSIPNGPGELRYIPELGGGALMDLGCYTLHFMRLITLTFEVIGEKGSLFFDQYVHPYRGFSIELKTLNGTSVFTEKDKDADYTRSTYAYQLDHVINVMQGRVKPLTGGQDAIETMRCIDELYAAAKFDRRFG